VEEGAVEDSEREHLAQSLVDCERVVSDVLRAFGSWAEFEHRRTVANRRRSRGNQIPGRSTIYGWRRAQARRATVLRLLKFINRSVHGPRQPYRVERWLRSSAPSSPTIARYESLRSGGWSDERIYAATLRVFERSLGIELPLDHVGQIEVFAEKYHHYPECGAFFVFEDRLIGFWDLFPLSESCFAEVSSGQRRPADLCAHDLAPLELSGGFCGYITALCTLREFLPRSGVLLQSMVESLSSLAQRGVFFEHLCGNAWTAAGARLCEHVGLQPRSSPRPEGRGVIYAGHWSELRDSLLLHPLLERYAAGLRPLGEPRRAAPTRV